jgi:hypothetical protein
VLLHAQSLARSRCNTVQLPSRESGRFGGCSMWNSLIRLQPGTTHMRYWMLRLGNCAQRSLRTA